MIWNPKLYPPVKIDLNRPPHLSDHGIRTDLIFGGLNSSNDWYQRFETLRSYLSNEMEDYVNIVDMKEFRIQEAETNHIENVNYTSNERKWVVKKEGNDEIIDEKITDSPKHDFRFSGYEAGDYVVEAYQMADFDTGIYAKYAVCEYLFDAETKNILYYTEKSIENKNPKGIFIKEESKQDWVATGDIFRIHVNALGEVESDGAATQRIE